MASAGCSQGSAALSLCTAAHPLYTRLVDMFGVSTAEAAMRPDPGITVPFRSRCSSVRDVENPAAPACRAPRQRDPAGVSVKVTGLAKLQVGPIFLLKIPITGLKLAQLLGQPCSFYRHGLADQPPHGVEVGLRGRGVAAASGRSVPAAAAAPATGGGVILTATTLLSHGAPPMTHLWRGA